jgi:hypothetical protein
MDIKRTLASQDLNPAGGTIYVGVHNLESVYRACVAWEKRRGIHRDNKTFGKYACEKKKEKIKLERPVKTPKPAKAPPVKLTAEELRERQRVRVAAYRAKNAEKVKVARKEHSRKYRANMTDEQRENRRINERRWAAERRERGTGR